MAKPKRKPVPNSIAVKKKQDGPNRKKALIWSASLIVLIIIAMSVLLIVNG
ncbi:hypothetical protein P7H21_01740 [Paenibacillus larvae]|nr:hypothetical protein [Paenibacillus larvae]MDT2303017.1 hypothetical protein [Paenibacillus larvae]